MENDIAPAQWPEGPAHPVIIPGEVHVWLTPTPVDCTTVDESLLSSEEQDRAEHMRDRHSRSVFISGRIALRRLLARYLNCAPERLCFTYGASGKPALLKNNSSQPLSFNISHSHGWMLIGVTVDMEMGIDLEQHTDRPFLSHVAQRLFHPLDLAQLDTASDRKTWLNLFYRVWCQREAMVKAMGKGARFPLHHIQFLSQDYECVCEAISPGESVHVETLCLQADWSAACAATRSIRKLHCWRVCGTKQGQ